MEPLLSRVKHELSLILHPELGRADSAFNSASGSNSASNSSADSGSRSIDVMDKELRAVMLRLMVQLLQGYRACLTLVRINPQPYITFHKSAFLGMRNLAQDCDFMHEFLKCMFFNEFISSRGPPWRFCDIFDELYADIGEQLTAEAANRHLISQHIKELGKKLFDNENYWSTHFTNGQNLRISIPLPTEGHMMRVHQPIFPSLDPTLVQRVIDEAQASYKHRLERSNSNNSSSSQYKLVPMGQKLNVSQGDVIQAPSSSHNTSHGRLSTTSLTSGHSVTLSPAVQAPNSARKLEVLRVCIRNIFENKISESKKTFPAVLRALKSKVYLHNDFLIILKFIL
jgi:myotubularin-related protein 5/13